MLFKTDEEKARSGVKSEILIGPNGFMEEELRDEKQPWER